MRGNEFLDKMELVNSEYVEAAEKVPYKKKKSWVKWGAIAACLAMIVVAGTMIFNNSNTSPIFIGGIEREYKNISILCGESAIEWPWEYKTLSEQYTSVIIEGKEYTSTGIAIDSSLIGEPIGVYDVEGYDSYTDKKHQMQAEVFENSGISAEHIIAVKLGNEYYTFTYGEYNPPATLGEVLDEYNLANVLEFNRFRTYSGSTENGYFQIDDDAYIWDVLSNCRDATFIQDDTWNGSERDYISFTATSDALGVYKRVFYVSSDGYVRTNIFDYAYTFQIGEEAAGKIISYATENGIKTIDEPYTNTLAGTITEISNGYIWVDDSILCKDASEGLIFKIPMDDLRISRCIDYEKIDIGDVVVVSFTGTIDVEAGYVVSGAYSVDKGTLSDGGVSVPE